MFCATNFYYTINLNQKIMKIPDFGREDYICKNFGE